MSAPASDSAPPHRGNRRLVRRAAAALTAALLVLLAVAAGWTFRAALAARFLSGVTGHHIDVRDVGILSIGGGIDGVVLRGLEVAAPGEETFLRVRTIDVEFTWTSIRRRRLDRVTVAGPRLDLARRSDGRWNVAALLGLDRPGPPAVEVGEVVVLDGEAALAAPVRLRATGIAARIVPDPGRVEAVARVAPDVAGGDLLGAIDIRVVAAAGGPSASGAAGGTPAAGGWRVETAAISAAGDGLRLDLAADIGETSARIDLRRLSVSEALLAALVAPPAARPSAAGPFVVWRGGGLEAGPAEIRADLDGVWSAHGRARLIGPSAAIGGRTLSLARLDLYVEARGEGAAGSLDGRLDGPGLAARVAASFGEGTALSLEGLRVEGPTLRALTAAAGLPGVERGRLTGRAVFEGGERPGAGAAVEIEEVRLALGGRTIDLAHDTLAVEARRTAGGWAVEASAHVEDAAHVLLRGLLDADGSVRSIDTLVSVVGDPGAIAALVAPEVTSRGGRIVLEAAGAAGPDGLSLAGAFRIPGLHVAHERWTVEAQRVTADIPFRIGLAADPRTWTDPRRLLRGLREVGGVLEVGRLGYGPYHAEEIRVRPAVDGDSLYLRDATFALYGGRGRWVRDASFRADDGYYEVRFAVEGVDLERLSREDLGKAHEAFRPPRIPAGEVALRGRADGTATLVGDDRGLAMIEIEFHSAGAVEVHRTIAAALYENFAYGALDSVLGPIRRRAEEAVQAGIERGVREGVEAAGRRFGVRTAGGLVVDTSAVRVDLAVRERIERRFVEETYIPYARASLAYETDVARPVKEVRLVLDEGSDTTRDNINYDVNILIPGGQDPTRFLGMLIDNEILRFGGGAVEVEYDEEAAATRP